MNDDRKAVGHCLAPRSPLPAAGVRQMWRVVRGVLRIDSISSNERGHFVRMALPGDVLGVERWAGTQHTLHAFALTPAEVKPLEPSASEAVDLLVETVVVAHQRAREALDLRSGPLARRVQRLLLLLAHAEGSSDGDVAALALPHLIDMSEILDAAPESVSRVFSNLKGLGIVQERGRQRARFNLAALRGKRSVMGRSESVLGSQENAVSPAV